MGPKPIQVAQGLEALAGELLGRERRMSWDMVGDTAVLAQASGLDLGELGDRLMDAYTLRNRRQAISALATTNWHMWERLPKHDKPWLAAPRGRSGFMNGTIVWDHSTYNRLYYEADVQGALARLRGSGLLTVAEFAWSQRSFKKGVSQSAFTKKGGIGPFSWRLEWREDVHPYFKDPPIVHSLDATGWYGSDFRQLGGSWTLALRIYSMLEHFIDASARLIDAGMERLKAEAG